MTPRGTPYRFGEAAVLAAPGGARCTGYTIFAAKIKEGRKEARNGNQGGEGVSGEGEAFMYCTDITSMMD